jgi:hypothetical protein
VNASALANVRINVDELVAWSQRRPNDRYQLVDAVRAAALPCQVFIDRVGGKISERTLRRPVAAHCGAALDRQAMIVASPVIAAKVVSRSHAGALLAP